VIDMENLTNLYHYTSVETLSLILKNRTIRFNNLCNVDDPTEEQSEDIQNFGGFVFVSCWTDTNVESIPMWRMYAERHSSVGGVRLKLPVSPFKNYEIEGYALRRTGAEDSEPELVTTTRCTFYPIDLILGGHWPHPNKQNELLFPIEYTEDTKLIMPKVFISPSLADENPSWKIDLDPIGRYKREAWVFQREWRYRFAIFPQSLKGSSVYATRLGIELDPSEMLKNLYSGIAKLPFSYVDLSLSDAALENMEITLSPAISDVARQDVISLVKEYCPQARIVESDLVGTIR
jgi:hypothetical protein